MLVHNKLTMNSGFDFDLLNEELSSILDIDMADFGFEEIEDVDIENFFEDKEEATKEKEEEEIQCPHCKMWFKK